MSSASFVGPFLGDFLVALPSSNASSTSVVIHSLFLSFYSALLIMQMLQFHLAGIYKLFISILRNMVRQSEVCCTFNRFKDSFFCATVHSKAVQTYAPMFFFVVVLYVCVLFFFFLFFAKDNYFIALL